MENQKKCSIKKHSEINAINYCPECKLYLCNKCSNYHSDLFENHLIYNIDKNAEEIFIDLCKEPNHKDKLEFYCKDHNKLCCPACLSKIKGKGNGQHFNCNVCLIEEIKDEKKNKLNENIKYLEDFSEKIDNLINELKKIFQKINENKEELKLKISSLFTKIRNTINEREDELLLELENIYEKSFFKEDLIKNGEKIPNQIKIYKENGKKLIKEWDNDNNKLNERINDCINIENNIKNIIEINENIDKCKSKKIDIHFYPEEEVQISEFLEKIKKFGEIKDEELEYKFKFKPGNNYIVTNNGLLATKNKGGDAWNCVIIGDKEIPKNRISKWKIKINTDVHDNYWDFYIWIGPNNFKSSNLYDECWSLVSKSSTVYLQIKNNSSEYNNHKEKLKKNDIIEVIVDRKLCNLSFAVNNINYGIACSNIPKEEALYPTIVIFQQNHSIEIV